MFDIGVLLAILAHAALFSHIQYHIFHLECSVPVPKLSIKQSAVCQVGYTFDMCARDA